MHAAEPDSATIPAPPPPPSAIPRAAHALQEIQDRCRFADFGLVGYPAYRAWVLAEESRRAA